MKLLIDQINKTFDKKIIFEDASFEFEQGKIYGLLGRNGAGKTTLFNCISQNMQLDSGKIGIEKEGVVDWHFDNTEIGFVYTQPHLPGFMTAYEFIKFFLEINQDRIIHPKKPQAYLTDVGILKEDHHRLLKDYSHGMKNKVQMLATMMVQPPVLLLDEPLTSFDVVAAHEMKELIIESKQHSIVIFSTHILQLAQDLCDEIVLLHNHQLTSIDPKQIHDPDFEEEVVLLLSEEKANE